nr:hypothetical protein [uncultured Pseudodesulfovibrio sp.]
MRLLKKTFLIFCWICAMAGPAQAGAFHDSFMHLDTAGLLSLIVIVTDSTTILCTGKPNMPAFSRTIIHGLNKQIPTRRIFS